MNKVKTLLKYIICGIIVGFVNGFFGGGGGMICVPFLNRLIGYNQKESHATTILVILPISIISVIIYFIKGEFAFDQTLYASGAVIVGGIIGAVLLSKWKAKTIEWIFAGVMLVSGIVLLC